MQRKLWSIALSTQYTICGNYQVYMGVAAIDASDPPMSRNECKFNKESPKNANSVVRHRGKRGHGCVLCTWPSESRCSRYESRLTEHLSFLDDLSAAHVQLQGQLLLWRVLCIH